MNDEETCAQCGRLCKHGGLWVREEGEITSPRANKPGSRESLYCGERCLRDRLLNIGRDEDPEAALQRQVTSANTRLHDEREANRSARSAVSGALEEALELETEIKDTEEGARLKRALHNARTFIERWR